jgi:hypothetical protein
MDGAAEQALWAQRQASRPVRVGDTMRRPAHDRSAYVDALLRHLAEVGFSGAPRPLGYDEHGRQILTFIEGEVPAGEGPFRGSDAQIRSATALIREIHDATASSMLRGPKRSSATVIWVHTTRSSEPTRPSRSSTSKTTSDRACAWTTSRKRCGGSPT